MTIKELSLDENTLLNQEIAHRVAISVEAYRMASADYAVALDKYTTFMAANPTRTPDEFPAPEPPAEPLTVDEALAGIVREAFAPVLASIAARVVSERVDKFAALSVAEQEQLLAGIAGTVT